MDTLSLSSIYYGWKRRFFTKSNESQQCYGYWEFMTRFVCNFFITCSSLYCVTCHLICSVCFCHSVIILHSSPTRPSLYLTVTLANLNWFFVSFLLWMNESCHRSEIAHVTLSVCTYSTERFSDEGMWDDMRYIKCSINVSAYFTSTW